MARYATNNTTSEGLVANAAMSTAEFMGFSRENGLGVYKSISLAANAYTILACYGDTVHGDCFVIYPQTITER